MATVAPPQHEESHWYERPRVNVPHGFWWFMFGNGGALSAIFLPVHELVQGVLGPGFNVPHWTEDAAHMSWVLGHPLVKLYLVVLCAFTFIHTAHRTIYGLADLGLLAIRRPLSYVLYGAALLGTVIAAAIIIIAAPFHL